jgi:hypothetical protein
MMSARPDPDVLIPGHPATGVGAEPSMPPSTGGRQGRGAYARPFRACASNVTLYVIRFRNADVSEEKLHDATSRHTGRKRRDFHRGEPPAPRNFVGGLCGQVRPHLSEEDMVLRVEAVKLEKIH